ncbi:MAG TPA: hypothetical protein VF779_00885 [Pyrinomonadaceae bacterium]
MDVGSLSLSISALIVSVLSFYFSIKSWRESNRPIITARVVNESGGNSMAALKLLVQNTGNRPAKNVALSVETIDLATALVPTINPVVKKYIEQIFTDRGVIPILENGQSVSNGFGFLQRGDNQTDWKRLSRFNIEISYQDLDGRKYKHSNPLLIADDRGFAGSWSESNG